MQALTEEERRMLSFIPAAKEGDTRARETLVAYVFQRYLYRLRNLYAYDNAVSRDDIRAEFLQGIYRGIATVDERGNPLYHLGQRGVWAVMSMCRAAARQRDSLMVVSGHAQVSLESSPELVQVPSDAEPFTDVVVRRAEVHDRVVSLVANTRITGTQRRLVNLILSGEVDPCELGFVKDAAKKLGVSAQRISQCMQQIRKAENARMEEAA